MTTYKTAQEVIGKNQSAVVIFTHGEHFISDPAGNGSTGKWVIDPGTVEEVDKVIIYLRRENETVNRIFLGNYSGLRSSDIPKRHIIRFSRLQEVGTTTSNWTEFASAGQNPVSYVIA
ncbi:MAG: HNH endonuclease [Anaerolineae bacterium]|nr:HNH endonuclease [Anaerolineae bacterium]